MSRRPKIKRIAAGDGRGAGFLHWCPACRVMHAVPVFSADARGRRHSWDGDEAAPTFEPDVDVSWRGHTSLVPPGRCHYALRAGVIHFYRDCTHDLRGAVVPLPPLPPHA
jgi:hypothetical protein